MIKLERLRLENLKTNLFRQIRFLQLLCVHSISDFLSKDFKNKISFEVSTSGSTGTPFKVLQDKNKKDRNVADTIYFGEKSGYELGHKLFYLRAWSSLIKKNSVTVFFQNIVPLFQFT